MKKVFMQRAFTLIEILVVIAIIGILVSIVSVNYNEAREQSRDKIRMSVLKEMQVSLELYKSQNGRYPQMGCGAPDGSGGHAWAGEYEWEDITWQYGCSEYIVGLVPDFIAALPDEVNKVEDHNGFIYNTDTDGTAYKLMSHLDAEALFVESYNNEFARCPETCGVGSNCEPAGPQPGVYAVYSKGAECW